MMSRGTEGERRHADKVSRTVKWKPPHGRVTEDMEGVRQRVIE